MSDFEDGEIVSDDGGEEPSPYTPLVRPKPAAPSTSGGTSLAAPVPRPRSSTNSSMMVNVGDEADLSDVTITPSAAPTPPDRHDSDSDENSDILLDSSSDNDSSDGAAFNQGVKKKKKKRLKLLPKEPVGAEETGSSGGGAVFQRMAAAFSADRERQGLPTRRRRSNNIWGSILQEESISAEMTAVVGVGRSLRDLGSDRGAETYDYVRAQELESERRREREQREQEELDNEQNKYWTDGASAKDGEEQGGGDEMSMETVDDRRGGALQAGRKRSVRERLGSRPSPSSVNRHHYHAQRNHRSDSLDDNMSIPPPGVARTLPDLVDRSEAISDEDLGLELATRLSEPKTRLVIGVVDLVGREIALELFDRTRQIELDGGMMIKNGERRRTPGGVYLQLLRDVAREDSRINEEKVRYFFAQSNRGPPGKKRHRSDGGGEFKSDLAMFKKLAEKERNKREEEQAKESMDTEIEKKENDEEPLKPLPDILSCISKKFEEEKGYSKHPDAFVEPEAPPNSVERPDDRAVSGAYEDEDDELLQVDYSGQDIDQF